MPLFCNGCGKEIYPALANDFNGNCSNICMEKSSLEFTDKFCKSCGKKIYPALHNTYNGNCSDYCEKLSGR